MKKRKNPAAVALGSLGGRASTAVKTPEERSELAKRGGEARWKDHEYSENPHAVWARKRRERLKREKQVS